MIFGVKHNHLLLGLKHKVAKPEKPIASLTRLGWINHGKPLNGVGTHFSLMVQEMDELNKMISDYFSIEDFGVKPVAQLLKFFEEKRRKEVLEKKSYIPGR